MPSAFFAQLALDATAAADEVMAEAWLLKPRTKLDNSAPTVADPSRPEVLFMGTYADPEAKPEMPHSYDGRQVRRPGVESGRPRVLVSPAALAAAQLLAGSPVVIVQDDHIERQADGVVWRVGSAFAMAAGSLKLDVNLLGRNG